jgi:hypothetical protein
LGGKIDQAELGTQMDMTLRSQNRRSGRPLHCARMINYSVHGEKIFLFAKHNIDQTSVLAAAINADCVPGKHVNSFTGLSLLA